MEISAFVVIGMAICYLLYAVVIIFGVPFNLFVLFRMIKLYRQSHESFRNGTGVCLAVLAIADLVSLSGICIHVCILSVDFALSVMARNALCKLVIFGMHLSTATSIWSWLMMSVLRWLSVYHPLLHYRLWRVPIRTLFFVLSCSALTNLPFLLMATSDPASSGCTLIPISQNWPTALNRIVLCVEIFWSFCLPTAIIMFMDFSVFLCRKRLTSDRYPVAAVAIARKSRPRKLWRWLVIALVDVGLNTPENFFRLGIILGIIDPNILGEYYQLARMTAQVLYYSQFAFNGVYLALFVYDKSSKPNRGSLETKRQKMMSKRSRSTDT
ncbi:G-PROTEIN-RECEP-F1-2 domain-containing protein [Aphelenchoides besseyi]|nr:G-PROTEIN-RECEP-F1-2 domain-containing protein [Aphelenchoides besseyi]